MGIVKNLLGGSPKQAIVQPAASTGSNTAEAEAAAEEEKRKRLVAMNQQGAGGQLTPAGGAAGQAPVARKMLFGL